MTKAMSKDPDERYQTAKDMLIDLRSLKKRLDVQAEIDRTSSPEINVPADDANSGSQKKKVLVLALIAMGVVTATILGINMWRSRTRTNIPAASQPPAPVPERTLTYWITVQKFRNGRPYQKPFTQPGEMIFEQDYQIRVHLRSPEPGYLYILNEGPASTEPQYVVLFPSSTANNGSPFLAAGQTVQIPEESWFEFDKQQGVEKLWLVFSEDAVAELEAVKQFASKRTRGLVTDPAQNKAIQNFLGSVTANPVREKTETLTTLKAPGKLLVYPVRLEHH